MNAADNIIKDHKIQDGFAVFVTAWQEGWKVPTPIPVDQWADTHRKLPRESSSEPGQWRTTRTPYLREPMQVLSDDHPCRRVVMIFGTQTGKTETGNNWIGSLIHQTPGPIMVVLPTVIMGKRWTRQRFNPMLESTKVLQDKIKPARSRDSGNTSDMKEFPGGVLVIAGANSAATLSQMPVRFLYMDETDRYPDDVDGEGHPVDLGDRRTSTFSRRKVLLTSAPTIKDESVIEDEFNKSDQRHYYLIFPCCGHEQILSDERLTDDGLFACEECGSLIEEHCKTEMLENGRWIAHNKNSDIPGFHLPSYYAPIGLGYSWKEIAALRIDSRLDTKKEKVYANTIKAESYEDESGKVDWQIVQKRASDCKRRTIPVGCLILVAGVDIQDDRFAIHIFGFGRGERIFIIDYFELPADPAVESEWDIIDEAALNPKFINRFGVEMGVLACGLDTGGHHTHMAYNFARKRKHRRVLAVKGSKFPNKPIIAARPTLMDVKVGGKKIRGGVSLWHVGTDTAKGAIYSKLLSDEGAEPGDYRMNFPADLTDDYYQQLTAERYDEENARWVKPRSRRNEVLDTTVYGYAAACHPSIRVHTLSARDWDKIEAKVQPVIVDMFSDASNVQAVSSETKEVHKVEQKVEQKVGQKAEQKVESNNGDSKQTKPRRAQIKRPRRGGFVRGWKQ